ncbi:GAF domain-containing sensor histidine kinase [Leptolyngbya sp. FACHB-321]|uniref:GAF domain-containing sensor histidine kinase n=1 Tax=Leptolyngbya sp. FACHB-321 TaxID=2692807 RepID=UPI00168718CF|nr:GAF domain-containing sensor histidine kinase [Leptolyngbya sp. FACHB-321]MBD2038167.1 GAF domain-containing sensor histidine kinase [Leptolyngbya sp. FACHB-321]
MIHPDNRLFCRLDGETVSTREQRRMLAIAALNLLETVTLPVFDEATQTAVHSLNTPICILSLMDQQQQHFKASVGLSRLGLMNDLATSRQFPRSESFCAHVVDSHQVLAIDDTFAHPAFAHSLLTQQYGVRAYLGVPLITSGGVCIGTLAVMDLRPHSFTNQEIEFLVLTARWSISEFERQQAVSRAAMALAVAKSDIRKQAAKTTVTTTTAASPSIASQLKAELLSQLTQELCTPLTSVMGMASVLTSEIYGPLTSKQKEYLGIIHHSGQYLLSLVNEILELSNSRDSNQLQLASVDIEMLCQQAINTLEQAARRREQQIRLSVEPGRRIWMLDKDKVRQMLYHLIFSVIQASSTSSNIRIHVSYRSGNLTISVWVSHPWLGEGLPYSEVNGASLPLPLSIASSTTVESPEIHRASRLVEKEAAISEVSIMKTAEPVTRLHDAQEEVLVANPHRNLGLLLSRQIAEMHNGQITIQSSPESGYRYVISLPQKAEASEPR